MPEMQTLLWEVGCEELPSWACEQLVSQVPSLVTAALEQERLVGVEPTNGAAAGAGSSPKVEMFVGPRRFAVRVHDVRENQQVVREEKRGPAERAAFIDGMPTPACEGFARSLGLTPADLEVRDDGCVWGTRTLDSEPITSVWPRIAEQVVSKINFAKPMRWGSSSVRFVRPVRWVATLFGEQVIPYTLWGVESSNTSRAHRFIGMDRTVTVGSAESYTDDLAGGYVLADQADRRLAILGGLDDAAREFGGEWFDPAGVLREVVHLVEQPSVIVGRFSPDYLELPERVLITAMQSHQRYLPVRTGSGELAPAFLTVMNGDSANVDSIRPGYERVLAGRLDDAVFSVRRDHERGLTDMASAESLGAVVFHVKAGSLGQRRDRIAAVAAVLATELRVDTDEVGTAAFLAKGDQVSVLVQEFAELEGFAGSLYAAAEGHAPLICDAIDQQFLPRSADGTLPENGVPAVIALADKIELLATMFAIGERPSGSRDPHGLRRAAIGVMRIITEYQLSVDLRDALNAALELLGSQNLSEFDADEVVSAVISFVDDRVERALIDDGVRVDAVRAARAAGLPRMENLRGLALALNGALNDRNPQFLSVLAALTRCIRIVEKAEKDGVAIASSIDSSTCTEDPERQLVAAIERVQEPIRSAVMGSNFQAAVATAAELGPVVDLFFDKDNGVMVMADDEAVRANRLAIVQSVVTSVVPLGDLTLLQLAGE